MLVTEVTGLGYGPSGELLRRIAERPDEAGGGRRPKAYILSPHELDRALREGLPERGWRVPEPHARFHREPDTSFGIEGAERATPPGEPAYFGRRPSTERRRFETACLPKLAEYDRRARKRASGD